MFEVGLYFIVSYVLILGVIVVLRERRKRQFPLSVPAYICLILSPFAPYVQVAIQTALYGKALLPCVNRAIQEAGFGDGPIFQMRVLKITPSVADVYVVQRCADLMIYEPTPERSGLIYHLHRTAEGWQYVGEDVVFNAHAAAGADGNTFPPYPDN